jgi:hypothetical protein
MVLDHLAAMFFFSGPLFYIGLLMAIDPAGIPTLYQWLLRVFRHCLRRLSGLPPEAIIEPERTDISRRVQRALRYTGVALLVLAVVI